MTGDNVTGGDVDPEDGARAAKMPITPLSGTMEQKIGDIRRKFMTRLTDDLAALEPFVAKAKLNQFQPEEAADIKRRVHKIAGTASTFGIPALSAVALEFEHDLERLLKKGCKAAKSDSVTDTAGAMADQLRSALIDMQGDNDPGQAADVHDRVTADSYDRNILIVDDDEIIHNLLHSALRQRRYKTMGAGDGVDVMDILFGEDTRGFRPRIDLMILDVDMPRMNGFDLLKRLKSTPRIAEIPVIMLTARHDIQSLMQGMETGALEYVTKPFLLDEMLALIDRILTDRRPIVRMVESDESR